MNDPVFDTLIIGPLSRDVNIDCDGRTVEETGGAVVQSSFAARAGGHRTAVFTKAAEADRGLCSVFSVPEEHRFFAPSAATTSIVNRYLSADKERRVCTARSVCDPFRIEEFPRVESRIYHFAGLIVGDFSEELIVGAAERSAVAVDVQAFLRRAEGGRMEFADWERKREVLPAVRFLKTDAAEALILTGTEDRREAARILHGWGAAEVMVSHNTEIIVYDGTRYYDCPIRARNLSGRTGRGDTVFAAYITERLNEGPEAALLYATAAVSLKMETPGPLRAARADVEGYIDEFYRDRR